MTGVVSWAGGLPWLAVCLGVLAALILLRRPLRSLGRLVGLGVNLFNALVLGVMGAPGFGLLMMLKWVLR